MLARYFWGDGHDQAAGLVVGAGRLLANVPRVPPPIPRQGQRRLWPSTCTPAAEAEAEGALRAGSVQAAAARTAMEFGSRRPMMPMFATPRHMMLSPCHHGTPMCRYRTHTCHILRWFQGRRGNRNPCVSSVKATRLGWGHGSGWQWWWGGTGTSSVVVV